MTKDSILIKLSESEDTDFGKKDFHLQSTPQKVFSAIWDLESQVNNGGFAQYFSNSSSESVPFVVQALETVGAKKAANICKLAIVSAFPAGLPQTPEAISSAASTLPETTEEELNALDQEFFGYPDNLTDLLFAYVSRHPEEFGTLPEPD